MENKKNEKKKKTDGERKLFLFTINPLAETIEPRLEKMLGLQRQLKPCWSIPFPFTESVVSAAFYMKNVAQSGPVNLSSVHIRPRHDSAAQIDTLR